MQISNLFSETERDMTIRYIEEYAGHGSVDTSFDNLFSPWFEAKSQYLFKMFNNNLILSKEIEITKSEYDLEEQINSSLRTFDNTFFKAFSDLMYDPSKFDVFENRYFFDELMHASSLISNKYNGNSFSFVSPKTGKEVKIQSGTKTLKALYKIAEAYDLPGYEEFRLEHSRILNQKTLKGNLCLSIHPLDYMTMSDNNCGWDSCMSWEASGCYRQGTVEMMNSPMVIVAYLTSTEDMYMPGGYYWNSKKWRELIVVNNEVIVNIKSYPYYNQEITKYALEWVRDLAVKANVSEYEDNYHKIFTTGFNARYSKDGEGSNEKYYINPYTRRMYNDFGRGYHFGYFNTKLDVIDNIIEFNYSGVAECMCCGAIGFDFDSEEDLVCKKCEPTYYCAHCDDRISEGYEYEVDGEILCEYCYSEHTVNDVFGCTHIKDNCVSVCLFKNKDEIKWEKSFYLYHDDIEYFESKYLLKDHKLHRNEDQWGIASYYTIEYNELNPENIKDFYEPLCFEDNELMNILN